MLPSGSTANNSDCDAPAASFPIVLSLAVATCQPGYHPAAQIHASEQINYIAQGELFLQVCAGEAERNGVEVERDAVRARSGCSAQAFRW